MKAFPSKLREIRKQKGFTQESISQLLGIGQSSYAKWENGKTEPTLENIGKLSKILDVSVDFLLSNDSVVEFYRNIFSANPKVTDEIESKIINDLDIYIDKLDNQIYNAIALTIYKEATIEEIGKFLGSIIFHYKKLFEIEDFVKEKVRQHVENNEEKDRLLKIIDSILYQKLDKKSPKS
ncbi:TPA: helix-turn-helix transcriptional regulator [Streptococcus pyogenes]|nr:helix-turn-helix transcriptional regulator [Streptococcus pyogenes]RXH50312.1 XRE family transcriptional regulator [Streptococcus pyogenes]HEP1276637.1 helix-turn-helix transcriptional regulator [Streptococcus pyogenes]HEQ1315682.1 helix-turn-helix transcriptional regulator [Streptococcus pyogenes]HER7826255.1 helix-turn-helix transcriptional regulator [Streptococcus pyogenes]